MVEAIQFADYPQNYCCNANEVSEFSGMDLLPSFYADDHGRRMDVPVGGGKVVIRITDWLVKNSLGNLSVMTDSDFQNLYYPED